MSRRNVLPAALRWATCGLLSLALAVIGCGSRTNKVSGTVTFKGRPLPSGTVLFHYEDGRVEHALITEGGSYIITRAPPGPARITVRSHSAAPPGLPSSGRPPAVAAGHYPRAEGKRDGKYARIPPRYLDPEKSGLRYTVRAGSQTYDIALQP